MRLPQFKLRTLFIAATLLAIVFFISFRVPGIRVSSTDAKGIRHTTWRFGTSRQITRVAVLVSFDLFVAWYMIHRWRLKMRDPDTVLLPPFVIALLLGAAVLLEIMMWLGIFRE